MMPARPRVAMQSSADDLPCAPRPWLPVRSFRHLLLLWRRLHRRARRMRLGTVQRRSNAPGIALARPRVARQCHGRASSDAIYSLRRSGRKKNVACTRVCGGLWGGWGGEHGTIALPELRSQAARVRPSLSSSVLSPQPKRWRQTKRKTSTPSNAPCIEAPWMLLGANSFWRRIITLA